MKCTKPTGESGTARTAESPASARQAGVRLLVAEDDPLLARAYRRLFEGLGWKVEVASTAPEAIAKATDGVDLVDLAVIDVQLVDTSGMDVVYFLLPEPVGMVVVSGTVTPEQAYEIGCTGSTFLAKPASPEKLVEACLSQLAYARDARAQRHSGVRVRRDRVERAAMVAALERLGGSVTQAARALRVDRSQFRRRAHALGITLPSEPE